MFQVKVYKPVDGKMVLQEVVSGQDASDITFNREMQWKHDQLKRWREENKRPYVKCLHCSNTFKQAFGKKYCSAKCGKLFKKGESCGK